MGSPFFMNRNLIVPYANGPKLTRLLPRQPSCRMPHQPSRQMPRQCHVGCHINVHVIDGWTRGIICDIYFWHRYWTWVGFSGLQVILWQFRNVIGRANLWCLRKKCRSIQSMTLIPWSYPKSSRKHHRYCFAIFFQQSVMNLFRHILNDFLYQVRASYTRHQTCRRIGYRCRGGGFWLYAPSPPRVSSSRIMWDPDVEGFTVLERPLAGGRISDPGKQDGGHSR